MDYENDSNSVAGSRIKSHETPRKLGYNDKSGAASARLRQLKKRQQELRRRLSRR